MRCGDANAANFVSGQLTEGNASLSRQQIIDESVRLKGSFSSTPFAAGGYLYAFSESGTAFVVKPEADKGVIVSELDLAETILCSPGAANGALYVRSDQHLFKLAKRP